jgi:hypothetical protein
MTHSELTTLIATMQVAKSKVNDWLGRNVRCPSLIPGTLYIMKEWSIKHHANYDNPFSVVEFVGSGREDTGERVMFAENPAIKDMKDGDYFYFKAFDNKDQPYIFGAYMYENCVCITSSAVRVTCYAIIGHESVGLPQGNTKTPRVPTETKHKENAEDNSPVDTCDDDDGLGCPGAVVCHPISMAPLKKQPIRNQI